MYVHVLDGLAFGLARCSWPSHGLPILTCMVGGGAGRAMERRALQENVAWAMRLVRKLFGEPVPDPTRAVQTAWDQDPFAYGAYSCAGKGVLADDGFTIAGHARVAAGCGGWQRRRL
jgi:hypothetical protein